MEFPSEILEQIAFNTRPKIEEQMLIAVVKSTCENIHPNHFNQIKKIHKNCHF